MIERLGRSHSVCASLVAVSIALVTAGPAQSASPEGRAAAARSFRDERLAYLAGLQAYLYGYPAVDFAVRMREETTRGASPTGVYAPVNAIYNFASLSEPGGVLAGKAPNNDTVYFSAWLDLRGGPLLVDVPDTHDRYYTLSYVDFYSEVQHTGRRTTGTKAQQVLIAGPDWQGEAPRGAHRIRLATHQGLLFGRVLVDGARDLDAANGLIAEVKLAPYGPHAAATPLALPSRSVLSGVEFFDELNRFLRENPRLPGEEALMVQLDTAGLGPGSDFDPTALSEAARRGLEQAIADGERLLRDGAIAEIRRGWPARVPPQGVYHFAYLMRAVVEYLGLFANRPEESIYPGVSTDANGLPLTGEKAYRMVFTRGAMPPVDAFWSLTAYNVRTADLIPNEAERYSLGDRTPGLVFRPDGSLEIRIQAERPRERDVNWLPVSREPFFLTLRMYQPRPEALGGSYRIPPVEETSP